MMVSALSLINYGLLLFFGVSLSVIFAGGCTPRHGKIMAVISLLILSVQIVSFCLFGLETTEKIYPLITHLPLLFMLMLVLKQPFIVSLVSIMTSYFCCQPPKWVATVILSLFHSQFAYEIGYLFSLVLFFFVLRHYLTDNLYQVMTQSRRSLILFGVLPFSYYLFDYATTVYTDVMYRDIYLINEFLPTVMVFFYIIFIALYHNEMQKKIQFEMENLILAAQTQQAKNEIKNLRQTQQQAISYRHDLRHHINLIHSLLETGQIDKTLNYLTQVEEDIDNITPLRFCENETVNLIFSSFAEKSRQADIRLTIQADVPKEVHIQDTELCSILSNGLENAIHACSLIESAEKRCVNVRLYIKNGKLCFDIRNNYVTEPIFEGGLPVSNEKGHGIGVKSMVQIIEKYGGVYQFLTKDGMFIFQASI